MADLCHEGQLERGCKRLSRLSISLPEVDNLFSKELTLRAFGSTAAGDFFSGAKDDVIATRSWNACNECTRGIAKQGNKVRRDGQHEVVAPA